MSEIISAEAFLVDLEVPTVRTDAVQAFTSQETIFVRLETSDGYQGLGYSYTIGTGGWAVLEMVRRYLLPRLVGQNARNIEAIWRDLYLSTKATSVGAITSLSLAAIDIALWDLRCKRADEPLWQVAGGHKDRVPLYDTEGGWLHLDTDELVAGALKSVGQGWRGIKVKVGKPHLAEDVDRLAAIRDAVGDEIEIMVDANQSMNLAEARRRAASWESLNLGWFEEPLPAEDSASHALLARSTSIPIAVGESLYSVGHFQDYLSRGGATIVQVDVARIGGITPWLKVAHLAEAFNVPVCPHFLMELHVSLAAAVPNGTFVEHIPQLDAVTRSRLKIDDGYAVVPQAPGIGIDWDFDALDDRRIS